MMRYGIGNEGDGNRPQERHDPEGAHHVLS